MPSFDGQRIPSSFVELLEDVDSIDTYAWGAAVLSFLLCGIKKYVTEGKRYIDGNCWLLLMFFFVRIPKLWAAIGVIPTELESSQSPLDWFVENMSLVSHNHKLDCREVDACLQNLTNEDIVWLPYERLDLPDELRANVSWVSRVSPIFCNNFVVHHKPHLVAKQFGPACGQYDVSSFDFIDYEIKIKDNRGPFSHLYNEFFKKELKIWDDRVCLLNPISRDHGGEGGDHGGEGSGAQHETEGEGEDHGEDRAEPQPEVHAGPSQRTPRPVRNRKPTERLTYSAGHIRKRAHRRYEGLGGSMWSLEVWFYVEYVEFEGPGSMWSLNASIEPIGSVRCGFYSPVKFVHRTNWVRVLESESSDCESIGSNFDSDGSGNFTTINDAIAAAPNNTAASDGYFLIFITEGVYQEYVSIDKKKKYLMLVGEGISKTIITGDHNVVDGFTTFNSATFAVVAQGLVAVNITFRNTAGPSKHQAVAVRNGADMSIFYRCSFEGYQDTLYTHSMRQFYRECDVYGTVDFIFGNAAVVLQNCNIYPRLPLGGQFNSITAQGRTDPNQNTGISIQNATVKAADDLAPKVGTVQTYLGRPWKQYSRTIFMQSFMDSLINPSGWHEWSGDFALNTLYYAEYDNTGSGSSTTNRVTWPGYHVIKAIDATNFTVSNFLDGDDWIPQTGVSYLSGLI